MPEAITDNIALWSSALRTRSTAGRGSNGKLEAYGIKKLRELILELAVRGKLLPQDPSDEPASELLKRIAIEKAHLNLGSRIRGSGDVLLHEATARNLPHGWVNVTASALFPTKSGNSKLIKGKQHAEPIDGLFPGYSASGQDVWLDDWEYEGIAIILSAVGARCGKAFLAEGKWSAVANTHIIWMMPNITLPEFAMLHLNNEAFWVRSGGAQPFVKVGETLDSPFRLPPLGEQHRIVAKVDELMALCDQLEQQQTHSIAAHQALVETLLGTLTRVESQQEFSAAWARIASHFDNLFTTEASIEQLKQTLLQLAVMGKLTPQDHNDEPASALLKRIQAEKTRLIAKGKIKKDKLLPPITDDEKPFELPQGWKWARFPELGEFGRGKSKHRPRNEPKLFNPGIYPLVQTGEVARAGNVIDEYHSKYSEAGLAQSKMWPAGTLCITIAANIADSAMLGFDACFPDSVVGFIPCEPLSDTRYFLAFMKTARENLLKFAPSTAQKNINLEILESVLIPLPPLKEIFRIVAKVDELMALCDSLKARIKDAQAIQIHLADAIVEQAVC